MPDEVQGNGRRAHHHEVSYGSTVRVRRIGKQSLGVNTSSLTAQDRIADQIGSEPHRQLRPSSARRPSGRFQRGADSVVAAQGSL